MVTSSFATEDDILRWIAWMSLYNLATLKGKRAASLQDRSQNHPITFPSPRIDKPAIAFEASEPYGGWCVIMCHDKSIDVLRRF